MAERPLVTYQRAELSHACEDGLVLQQNLSLPKATFSGQVQWLTPVIPALWEAEVGGSQSQEFEASLTNMPIEKYGKIHGKKSNEAFTNSIIPSEKNLSKVGIQSVYLDPIILVSQTPVSTIIT
ncbi:hypothetical protein AAY473_013382 [Plecturocebus cupreus]